jgi:hypothetical protein
MPSSSDRTQVGRTLLSQEVPSLPWRAETSNTRSRRKTSVLRPMISARTARIDDNLGRGTDGSNPLPSSSESATKLAPASLRALACDRIHCKLTPLGYYSRLIVSADREIRPGFCR